MRANRVALFAVRQTLLKLICARDSIYTIYTVRSANLRCERSQLSRVGAHTIPWKVPRHTCVAYVRASLIWELSNVVYISQRALTSP